MSRRVQWANRATFTVLSREVPGSFARTMLSFASVPPVPRISDWTTSPYLRDERRALEPPVIPVEVRSEKMPNRRQ